MVVVDIYKIIMVGIIAAILSLIIKKDNHSFSLAISIAASLIIFFMILPNVTSIINILRKIAGNVETSIPYAESLMKIIGVAYIAELGAQICVDAGETAISSKIELAGKVIILTISSPIVFALLQQVITMLP